MTLLRVSCQLRVCHFKSPGDSVCWRMWAIYYLPRCEISFFTYWRPVCKHAQTTSLLVSCELCLSRLSKHAASWFDGPWSRASKWGCTFGPQCTQCMLLFRFMTVLKQLINVCCRWSVTASSSTPTGLGSISSSWPPGSSL